MEIRLRLTLQFTVLVAFLLLAVLAINYYQAKRFSNESFADRLRERAIVVASTHLEQDPEHQSQFEEINRRYLQELQNEVVMIFASNNSAQTNEKLKALNINSALFEKLKKKEGKMIEFDGRQFMGINYQDNKGVFFIVASGIDNVGQDKLNNQLQTMFLSFFFFLVFIVLAGQYLAKKALTPIQFVMDQVTEISAANLHERVNYPNETDEIALLAHTFNQMLDRLEESFLSQSSFVQNASHELRNPLAAMIGHAETTLLKNRNPEYYEEELQIILQESNRLKHIVNSLLQLSQASETYIEINTTVIRLDELLLDVIEKLSISKNYNQILVVWPENQDDELWISGNASLLEVAISNLLDNACKYSDGKIVTCTFSIRNNLIQFSIEDQGIGISKEDISKVMNPFYRSHSVRNRDGFGIGMAISYKILNLHHIRIQLESELEKGTRIELTLERSAPPIA